MLVTLQEAQQPRWFRFVPDLLPNRFLGPQSNHAGLGKKALFLYSTYPTIRRDAIGGSPVPSTAASFLVPALPRVCVALAFLGTVFFFWGGVGDEVG